MSFCFPRQIFRLARKELKSSSKNLQIDDIDKKSVICAKKKTDDFSVRSYKKIGTHVWPTDVVLLAEERSRDIYGRTHHFDSMSVELPQVAHTRIVLRLKSKRNYSLLTWENALFSSSLSSSDQRQGRGAQF